MKTILLILLFLAPLSLLAQDDKESLSHHAIGLSASMLSGPGVSYQYIFNPDHRIKLTAFGFYEKERSGSTDLTAIVGGEYQFTAAKVRHIRFYIEVGGHFWHEKNVYERTSYPDYTPYTEETKNTTFAVGAGLGFEAAIEDHLLISIDGSLLFRKRKQTGSPEIYTSYSNELAEYFGPGIGIAAYYRF